MVHCLFLLWTHFAIALHLLATYYFLVVFGFCCLVLSCYEWLLCFFFSDYLTTILLVLTVSTWGSSKIFGCWSCNANLFSHFSSFIDFILDLNICFTYLAFSQADLTSLFSNSGIVTSLLNLVAFLVMEFLALDLSCSSTCFGYCPSSCASESD